MTDALCFAELCDAMRRCPSENSVYLFKRARSLTIALAHSHLSFERLYIGKSMLSFEDNREEDVFLPAVAVSTRDEVSMHSPQFRAQGAA